ncbi:MAG: GrpB family protein [Solirubrobacteraceae bacterium]
MSEIVWCGRRQAAQWGASLRGVATLRLVSSGDERDRVLDEVLIGGREQRQITIVEYTASWPARFELERARVRDALGDRAIRIEHIGSTAVPGLAAKAIIDILITVQDPEDEAVSVTPLTAAGYELRVREPGHRMLRTPGRDVHIHVWGDDDPEVSRCLRFRDRLRRSAQDRHAYEQVKRELARREWPDMNHYADAKGPVIAKILARADD